jgi:hypothetical protein
MKRLLVFYAVLMLLFGGLTATAWADVQIGNFQITFDPKQPDQPIVDPALNDGWQDPASGQQWFLYPNGEPVPFWNQWWYDDPPSKERWKEIFFDVTISTLDTIGLTDGDRVVIALNWSNMDYPETGPKGPPPNPDQEKVIERYVLFDKPVLPTQQILLSNLDGKPFVIPNFNPEWVSIDVWVEYLEPGAGSIIDISGYLTHECVPEPSAFVMLLIGTTGFLLIHRRKQ